jgi:thiamine monophosphate synthase
MLHYHPTTQAYVRDGEGFTHNGNQYPANWDKASLGFVEVTTVGTREDDRYFWVSEELADGVRTITNTPKDPEQIAKMESAKKQAEIDALEGGNPLARPTREFMLASIEERAVAAGYTLEQLRESHYGYRKVKEADEVIKALRAAL